MAKKIKIVKRDGTVSSIELGTKDSMSGGGTHKTVKIENSVEGYAALEGSAPESKLIITKGVNILDLEKNLLQVLLHHLLSLSLITKSILIIE